MKIRDVIFAANKYGDVPCDKSVVEFIHDLHKLLEGVAAKDRQAVKINFTAYDEYGEPTPYMEISYYREETRGEANKRRRDAKAKAKHHEELERDQFQRLQEKYG